ncbi:EFR1 family ferrodoxin [Clostridium sp. 'deep sea']|uniref:EFR1 family ferrodoxin n=1 Tax=Clostridium sp. 'deep sea' TaxID=2779445 RepID=UPI0018967C75|nr:EFR1 family ferrodoxin [Clostridium sp. 'deep sea']QOR35002.1 EFR1 family ferrodoxin [Clostridium sp. 'deep sea']
MKIFYFTATGNSLYVAKTFKANLYSIPSELNNSKLTYQDDKIGLIFPCYFGGVPRIVKEFLSKAKLTSDYVFVIITYGSSVMGTYNMLKQLALKNNIDIKYINKVKMVDNFIPLFKIEKELEKKDENKINDKIITIVRDVLRGKTKKPSSNFIVNFITKVVYSWFTKRQGSYDKHFYVTDNCNSCRVCEMVCPVNNIIVNRTVQFLHKCDYCLACTNLCPENAIRMRNEKSKMRYLNKHIKRAEIIRANDVSSS